MERRLAAARAVHRTDDRHDGGPARARGEAQCCGADGRWGRPGTSALDTCPVAETPCAASPVRGVRTLALADAVAPADWGSGDGPSMARSSRRRACPGVALRCIRSTM